ncbi:hypothetical protein COB72_04070 [bacterium]|nr:MAG: hypothetical protein COB72_04070 [bacterium]
MAMAQMEKQMKNETKKMVRVGVVLVFGAMALGLEGCNAVSGIGQDIQEISGHGKNLLEGKKGP